MDTLTAIRTRRTVKDYRSEPVPRDVLDQILEAGAWAPVHRMTQPWRFRVLGPNALEALKAAAGEGADKLMRAPTLVAASFVPSPLPLHADEDEQAAAAAVYATMLAAHAEGIASYWRTPGVLRTDEGRAACGIPDGERVLGLIHFGYADGDTPEAPERLPLDQFVTYLD
jgi:nitroreductase